MDVIHNWTMDIQNKCIMSSYNCTLKTYGSSNILSYPWCCYMYISHSDIIMDIHNTITSIHNGIIDVHNCCELWIFIIIVHIHHWITDIHNSIIDICNCILDNMVEDLTVLICTFGYPLLDGLFDSGFPQICWNISSISFSTKSNVDMIKGWFHYQ